MKFVWAADAHQFPTMSWMMRQWRFCLPVFCLLAVAGALQRAAGLRLAANGYPPLVRRLFPAARVTAVMLTIILLELLTPGVARAANGLFTVMLIASLGSLGFAAVALISAWLLPPRRGKSVVGPRRRRHHYRRWIPALAALGLLEAAYLWSNGDEVAPGLVTVACALLAFMLMIFERNYRNQEDDAESALSRQGSVLLLRTFTRDLFARDEGRLATEVKRQLGDFIALGNPREVLPPGGARRLYLEDGAWRAQLTELAVRSKAILMWPDATPAVRWELGMIRHHGLHRKLFVVVPPPLPRRTWLLADHPSRLLDNHPSRLLRFLSGISPSDWSEFAQALQDNEFGLPERAPKPGSVLAFEPDGRCVVMANGLSSARELVARIAGRLTVVAEPAPSSGPSRAHEQPPRNPDAATGSRRWRTPGPGKPHRQLMTNIIGRMRKEAG